jgi:hypothetical protein
MIDAHSGLGRASQGAAWVDREPTGGPLAFVGGQEPIRL